MWDQRERRLALDGERVNIMFCMVVDWNGDGRSISGLYVSIEKMYGEYSLCGDNANLV